MKKIIISLIIITVLLLLVGCGAKKCYTCGKSLEEGGYTAFGNNYCNYCFMNDLGID